MKGLDVLKQALGIDVSKDSLSICLGVLKQDLEKEFYVTEDVPNTRHGFKELTQWLKKASLKKELPIVVMEATGVYHERVAHYLHKLGHKVCIMQSGRVKRYAQSLDQRSKTDALDSRMLSSLGCERTLRVWIPPSEQLLELRFLSRERSALIREKSMEKNRNHAVDSSVLANTRAAKRFRKRIALLEGQIKEIESEMLAIVKKDEELKKKMGYLQSIPGVSFISAATVVAETFGFATINSAKQLVSYSGYDIFLRESGTFRGKTRISKKGNKYIRAVLHMPSMAAVRLNPTLKPFYERLKPNKAKPMVALVAVQRKLLVLMYSLWKNNAYYDADFEQKKRQKPEVPAAQDSNKIEFVAS